MIKYVFCDKCYSINNNNKLKVRKCNCCSKLIEPKLTIKDKFTLSQSNLYNIKTDFSESHSNFRHLSYLIRVGYSYKTALQSAKHHYLITLEEKDKYFFVPNPKDLYFKALKFYQKILILKKIRDTHTYFLNKYTNFPTVIINKIIQYSSSKPIDDYFFNYIKLFMEKSKNELNFDVKYFLNSP